MPITGADRNACTILFHWRIVWPERQENKHDESADGKANVTLFPRDGSVWMNQNQLAELFDTSKQNTGQHIANILVEKELGENSVVKYYLTTAADGKQYDGR
jgi:hypothetical protein